MSDKKPSKDTLLKKKSSRKKRAVSKIDKEVDIEKVKELIQKEMTNLKDRAPINNFAHNINEFRSSSSSFSEYDSKYKTYLQEEFTYNHFVIINRAIADSEKCPVELRNNYALHKYLYNTVKILLMNELEIVYFSIFLNNLGWLTKEFDLEENLLMTGISVKIYLNTNYNFIIEYLKNKNSNINDRFNTWLSHKKDYESILKIHPRDLNECFYKLKRPFNSHCKVNYVDYNCVVDQILQMSLPYCDTKTASTHLNKHNNNTLNNASNLTYSVKEEKQSNKNAKYIQNQYDNAIKTVHEQAEMSPVSQIKVEDQRFLISNNANNHTQNFVKTLNSNHSISFIPSQSTNLNQNINSNTNPVPIQQTIQENINVPKLDINEFRKFDSNASFGLFNENSNIHNYLISNDFGAIYSRMQSQNIGLNEEEYRNNLFKGMSRYNFDVPKNVNVNEHEIVNIQSIKKEPEAEFKSQDFSFQEQISFEARNKDNLVQNETKEPGKNQSIFTKTENSSHSFKSSAQSDKKDALPTKSYKLELKSNDNNKTFGNPFNKNVGFFNNNPSNIKNNIVLINNTSSNDQKDLKVSSADATPVSNSSFNNSKDINNNKNLNNIKKQESVSQFYN